VTGAVSCLWWRGLCGFLLMLAALSRTSRRQTVPSNNYFMTILEEAARYSFSVSIKISYPVPGKSAALRILLQSLPNYSSAPGQRQRPSPVMGTPLTLRARPRLWR
jgi:hypothetical protein